MSWDALGFRQTGTTAGTLTVEMMGQSMQMPYEADLYRSSDGRVGGVAAAGPQGTTWMFVSLVDGGFHAVDSSAVAFEIAAKAAYRQSIPKAGPQLLEPIMKLDVFTPEDNVGDVIGDLNRRRGMIKEQEPTPTGIRVKADAPLSDMFGYIGDLRTMTSGRGQFSMEFSHYAPCPKNVADEVIEEVKKREAEKAK